MRDLVIDFLRQKKFAVAGSFRNKDKFAYRALVDLIEKGYGFSRVRKAPLPYSFAMITA
jgi:predicted CoA-binding protein